jgi:hypothetical protein
MDPEQLKNDKDFMAASPADQHGYLSSVDKDYASANPADQAEYREHLGLSKNVADIAHDVPRPQVNMKMSPWGAEPQGMPGASEGAGLAEPLGQYTENVARGVGGGAKDIAQGNVARGAHKVIGGVGEALTPALPFAAAGAPLATLGALGGGQAGGMAGKKIAETAGATPDQAAVAGDIGNIAGGFAGGALGHMGQRSLPGATFERAKAGFRDVASTANPAVVDTSVPGNTALEIQKMAASGGSQPKVIRDFVTRVTDPNKGPLTFEEARKFYTNASRLSADESQRLTPDMKRMVGQFRADLDGAITNAAASKGKGPQYTKAMKDYRRASRAQDVVDTAKDTAKDVGLKAMTHAVAPGLVGYGLYRLLK